MSKKNKVVKLGSKERNNGKSALVTYNGVEMTRFEREALIRASQVKVEAKKVKQTKKGTKVAEPSHSKLFNILHPNKKQTVAPSLKSVENTAPVVEKKKWTAPEKKAPVVEPEPVKEEPVAEPVAQPVVEPVVEVAPAVVEEPVVEAAPVVVEEPAVEPVAEPVAEEPAEEAAPVVAEEPAVEAPAEEAAPAAEEEDDEEDDLTQGITKKNAKKRISPNFVKRVGTTSAKGCDESIKAKQELEAKIADLDAQIAKAKTPKNASDEEKAALNETRKALRAEKKQAEKDYEIASQKAIALERAADGYSDIYKLLTGNELSIRKTERINPYAPLSDEQEQEVLNSLWAQKGARK